MRLRLTNWKWVVLIVFLLAPRFSYASVPISEAVILKVQVVLLSLTGAIIKAGIIAGSAAAKAFVALVVRLPFDTVVSSLWVVVLGITNLGFFLALLFIALLTVLRLEVGGGTRRLLPRLFIGALLVNFSLVIAQMVLDLSSIAVASLTLAYPGANLNTLDATIIEALGYVAVVGPGMAMAIAAPMTVWSNIAGQMVEIVLVWTAALSLWLVVAMLIIRAIILAGLMIVSPIAYLVIAVPNAGGWAKKWWGNFLGWAIFPVAVLFVIFLALDFSRAIADSNIFGLDPSADSKLHFLYMGYRAIIVSVVTTVGFVASVIIGRKVAQAGSALVLNAAGKARRGAKGLLKSRLGRLAGGGPPD